jgi:membrane protein implicated in regulation of membrane protease activity
MISYVLIFISAIIVVIPVIVISKVLTSKNKSYGLPAVNSTGIVTKDILKNGYGAIFLNGETWRAWSDEPIEKGRKVIVIIADKNSLILKVTLLDK